LPAEITDILVDVVIYINISYRFPGQKENILGACCHQSAQWLLEVSMLWALGSTE